MESIAFGVGLGYLAYFIGAFGFSPLWRRLFYSIPKCLSLKKAGILSGQTPVWRRHIPTVLICALLLTGILLVLYHSLNQWFFYIVVGFCISAVISMFDKMVKDPDRLMEQNREYFEIFYEKAKDIVSLYSAIRDPNDGNAHSESELPYSKCKILLSFKIFLSCHAVLRILSDEEYERLLNSLKSLDAYTDQQEAEYLNSLPQENRSPEQENRYTAYLYKAMSSKSYIDVMSTINQVKNLVEENRYGDDYLSLFKHIYISILSLPFLEREWSEGFQIALQDHLSLEELEMTKAQELIQDEAEEENKTENPGLYCSRAEDIVHRYVAANEEGTPESKEQGAKEPSPKEPSPKEPSSKELSSNDSGAKEDVLLACKVLVCYQMVFKLLSAKGDELIVKCLRLLDPLAPDEQDTDTNDEFVRFQRYAAVKEIADKVAILREENRFGENFVRLFANIYEEILGLPFNETEWESDFLAAHKRHQTIGQS